VDPSPGDVTSLLNSLADGDQGAAARLVPLIYKELQRLAARCLRRERRDHTLQATALVHEAYIKLTGQRSARWENRAQFFAVASQLMRRILVDYARRQERIKRGGRQHKVSLNEVLLLSQTRTDELLAVHESLSRLERLDPRQGRIVELRYFGGLTVDEAAHVLGISSKTVLREWNIAKAWLYGELKERHGDDARQLEQGEGAI
jgi:RNA polymerase sigma factor (TIGR02999 family)